MASIRQKIFQDLNLFDYLFLALTLLLLPLIYIHYALPFQSKVANVFNDYYLLLWFLFTGEHVLRFFFAPSKKQYIKKNWASFFIIIFPAARLFIPIELWIISVLVVIDRLSAIFSPFHLQSFFKTAILAIIIVSLSTYLILLFESPFPTSHIQSLSDALWWSTVGISTIGIGNIVPISFEGKILTIFLMISGIFLFGLFTANLASFFTEKDVKTDMNNELHEIEQDLSAIDGKIERKITVEESDIEKKLNEMEARLSDLEKRQGPYH